MASEPPYMYQEGLAPARIIRHKLCQNVGSEE